MYVNVTKKIKQAALKGKKGLRLLMYTDIIHPYIFFSDYPSHSCREHRVSQWAWDTRSGDILRGLVRHIHTFTYYAIFRDANQPTRHFFGLGEKPEYLQETPEAWGENANSVKTQGRNHTNDPEGARQMC